MAEDNLEGSNEDTETNSMSLLESESKGTNSRIVFEEFTDDLEINK
jgi:hypothetical protein